MTVIAYKDGEMAADSGCWNGGRVQRCPFPKITRGADGSLWALTGKMEDSWSLRGWVLAGMDQKKPPVFVGEGEDRPSILVAKPDGVLWTSKGSVHTSPCVTHGAWGDADAGNFCEGAMEAGLSPGDAVALTIRCHIYAYAPVQIERVKAAARVDLRSD